MVAIKGNEKYGLKIIKYLEKLGGNNYNIYNGHSTSLYYYIKDGLILANDKEYFTNDYKLLSNIPVKNKIYELW